MFNFTTTTIVNSVLDSDYKVDSTSKTLYIKNVGSFDQNVKVTKRAFMPEKMATATITMPDTANTGDIFRINVELGLYKSESSLYARPWPTKGKPLYIEAVKGSGALEDTLKDNAGKYMNLVYDTDIIEVTKASGKLVLTAKEGTQEFKTVALEKWVPDTTGNVYAGGVWETVGSVDITKGYPGFGTYNHIIHNVILPTYENMRYGSPKANVPELDGNYSQYVITMEKVRDTYGTGAVGQKLTSVTEHVFWVANRAESDFETKLTAIDVTPKSVEFDNDPDYETPANEASVLDD